MRIVAAEPEHKRPIFRPPLDEVIEILELRTRRIPFAAAGLESSGAPALSSKANGVARLLQQIGIDGKSLRQKAVQVAALREPVHSLARQQRCARRRARRSRDEGAIEPDALARDPIEYRRPHCAVAIDARVRRGPVVCDREQNVGAVRRRRLAAMRAAGRSRQDPRQDSDPREGLHVLTPAPWARNRARKYFRTRTGSADSRISAKQYPWKSMACSAQTRSRRKAPTVRDKTYAKVAKKRRIPSFAPP